MLNFWRKMMDFKITLWKSVPSTSVGNVRKHILAGWKTVSREVTTGTPSLRSWFVGLVAQSREVKEWWTVRNTALNISRSSVSSVVHSLSGAVGRIGLTSVIRVTRSSLIRLTSHRFKCARVKDSASSVLPMLRTVRSSASAQYAKID